VTPPKVVHLSPFEAPTPLFTARREGRDSSNIGSDAVIIHLRDVGYAPGKLSQATARHEPDAIVLASASFEHRQAVMSLADATLILHPVWEEYRTARGERQERLVGFGVMREHGPRLLGDGAVTDRSAITQELASQRALQQQKRAREQDERGARTAGRPICRYHSSVAIETSSRQG
jgi:hypothetical protein